MHEQEEKLRQELLTDAHRKADRMVARAKRDAEKLLAAARSEIEQDRAGRLRAARSRADKACQSIAAGISRGVRELWLTTREQELENVFSAALTMLRTGAFDGIEESLFALVTDGLGQINAEHVIVTAGAKEIASLQPASDRWKSECEFRVSTDPETYNGVILETQDGRRRCDHSYTGRFKRMKEELRRLAGGILTENMPSDDDLWHLGLSPDHNADADSSEDGSAGADEQQ